jgi:hypothetical protein
MSHVLAPHTPVSLRRFPMPVAACFSYDGARENRVIQSQLVEIFAVFEAGGGGEKWGVLFDLSIYGNVAPVPSTFAFKHGDPLATDEISACADSRVARDDIASQTQYAVGMVEIIIAASQPQNQFVASAPNYIGHLILLADDPLTNDAGLRAPIQAMLPKIPTNDRIIIGEVSASTNFKCLEVIALYATGKAWNAH